MVAQACTENSESWLDTSLKFITKKTPRKVQYKNEDKYSSFLNISEILTRSDGIFSLKNNFVDTFLTRQLFAEYFDEMSDFAQKTLKCLLF